MKYKDKTVKKELPLAKTPNRIWTNMSRKEIINLAEKVANGDEKAIEKAMKIHHFYCQNKKANNDLFSKWQKEGRLSKDKELNSLLHSNNSLRELSSLLHSNNSLRELRLSAEFLGSFCRCIQEIKETQSSQRARLEKALKEADTEEKRTVIKRKLNNLSGIAYGSCQKSIYNNRGLKGVATRGPNKVECDDELAIAQNILKKIDKC